MTRSVKMNIVLVGVALLGTCARRTLAEGCGGLGSTWGPGIGPPPAGCGRDDQQKPRQPEQQGAPSDPSSSQQQQQQGTPAQPQRPQGEISSDGCGGLGSTWGPGIGPPPAGCDRDSQQQPPQDLPMANGKGSGGKAGDGGKAGGGGRGNVGSSSSPHAVAPLGTIARTTRSGTSTEGDSFAVGEDIYGPFEAGFSTQQNGILEALGCSSGNLGHVTGGIDTHTAEQMVAHQCDVTLPRWEGSNYISLLDSCGGHTRDYHFHERMTCLYSATGAHSLKVGEATGGQPIYGKWEDADNQVLPELDACGGHWGRTPESPDVDGYHYHVQGSAPFTFGCLGPNDDDSLVTVAQCRAFYPEQCDGALIDVTTTSGTKQYDLWCPCFDANGSNSGVDIAELTVFASSDLNDPAIVKGEIAKDDVAKDEAEAEVAATEDNTGTATGEQEGEDQEEEREEQEDPCNPAGKSIKSKKQCQALTGSGITCVWKMRACVGTKGALKESQAATTGPPTHAGACAKLTTSKKCKKDTKCQWKAKKCQVAPAAGPPTHAGACAKLTTSKKCKKDTKCQWKAKKCQVVPATGPPTHAGACAKLTTSKKCKKDTKCQWKAKRCHAIAASSDPCNPAGKKIKNQQRCAALTGNGVTCVWDKAAKKCAANSQRQRKFVEIRGRMVGV